MKQAGKWMAGICLIIMAFLLPVTGFSWPVPDTNQTSCHNNGKEIFCPSPGEGFYGQDASYTINPMSYTKLDATGNDLPDSAAFWSMVRDNVTGLIWEVKQAKDDIQNYANPHDADNIYTWYDSNPATNGGYAGIQGDGTSTFDTEQYINTLNTSNYGGHNDWRMPTLKELAFIVDYSISEPGPTIDETYFPNIRGPWYWSSTTYTSKTNHAWAMGFYYGYVSSCYKIDYKYVRAVRGGQLGSLDHLVINGDGTVTDTSTNLTWQQANAIGRYKWQEALAYCENLTLGGQSDWRLPTTKELRSLVDYSHYGPAIDATVFPGTRSAWYWSSTPRADGTYYAWGVNLNYGYDGSDYYCNKYYNGYVRAVRGGQAGILNPDIKANGSDEPIYIVSTDNLSITIDLSPGGFAGKNADWWLVEAAPSGLSHYLPTIGSWASGLTYSHQGPMFNLGKFEVLNISGLPAGSYTYYFGVDINMNGLLDMDHAYYDSVTVNIQ